METIKEITKGFQKTKAGLIPIDWSVFKLEDLGEFKNGINKDKDQFGFGYPMVNINDIFTLNKGKTEFSLVNSNDKERKDYNLIKGDVLFVRSSVKPEGVGLTQVIEKDLLDTVFSGFIIRYRTNGEILNEFKRHCFSSYEFRKNLLSKSTISANTNINQQALNSLRIAVPPVQEQQKIASILSTWDQAIEGTTNLIEQLKLRKKGLMEQLLTGKKRLKGFDGEWRTIPINRIAKHYSVKNKKDEEITVLSCTKYDGLVPSLEYFGRQVYGNDTSKYKMVPRGYFAYATNHIEEGSIGTQDKLDCGLVSPMYTVFKTDESIDDSFFFKLLKTDRMIYAYQSNMSGSIARRGGLRWDAFANIEVKIPEREEQTAIANLFDKLDEELLIAKEYLNALKKQKKGLMQQLLTGQKRVSIN